MFTSITKGDNPIYVPPDYVHTTIQCSHAHTHKKRKKIKHKCDKPLDPTASEQKTE